MVQNLLKMALSLTVNEITFSIPKEIQDGSLNSEIKNFSEALYAGSFVPKE